MGLQACCLRLELRFYRSFPVLLVLLRVVDGGLPSIRSESNGRIARLSQTHGGIQNETSCSSSQHVDDLRLASVPHRLTGEQWSEVLQGLNLTTETACSPTNITGFHQDSLAHLPRIILTVTSRWGDLHAALLSLKDYPKITVTVLEHCAIPLKLTLCFPMVEWLYAPLERHLSSAWNVAIDRHSRSENSWIICNDDVLFPPDWQERLKKARAAFPRAVWMGLTQSIQFSGFWMSRETVKTVGRFDEVFTTYFEDDDFWVRLEACYGSKVSRPVLYPEYRPVVLHRRTGWHWSRMKNMQMAANKRISHALFFQKWRKVVNSSLCWLSHCCLHTRQSIIVESSLNTSGSNCLQSCRYLHSLAVAASS